PQPHHLVVTAGSQARAVGRERQALDLARVSLQTSNETTGSHIPHLHHPVDRYGQRSAVGGKANSGDLVVGRRQRGPLRPLAPRPPRAPATRLAAPPPPPAAGAPAGGATPPRHDRAGGAPKDS